MDANTDNLFIAANTGETVTVTLTDGTNISGSAISVNSKGVNLKVDGKVRSFGLARIDVMGLVKDNTDDLEAIYAELHDGMTTAELAAVLSDATEVAITPKELRVHLRALGLGVGKGRKYSLTASEFRSVKAIIAAS